MIPRKTPMPPRRERMARQAIKKVNTKRRKSTFERAYGGRSRVAFVKSLPCIIAGVLTHRCEGPIDNTHVVGGGASRKADASHIVPLCRWGHIILHSYGVETFEREYSIDLSAAAARTEAAWRATQGGDRQ